MMNFKNPGIRRKTLIPAFFLFGFLPACKKDFGDGRLQVSDEGIQQTMRTSLASVSSGANLLYEETMEGSAPFSSAAGIENCGLDYALQFVTNPVFEGAKSARFEIRKDQPLVGSAKKIRSEVSIIKG